VVWLCAAGFHSSGDNNDFYPQVERLDAERRLLPAVEEIANSSATSGSAEPTKVLRELLADALANSDKEFRVEMHRNSRSPGTSGSMVAILVEVVVDESGSLEEIFVGIQMLGAGVVGDFFGRCLTALLPATEAGDFQFQSGFPHRAAMASEVVVSIVRSR